MLPTASASVMKALSIVGCEKSRGITSSFGVVYGVGACGVIIWTACDHPIRLCNRPCGSRHPEFTDLDDGNYVGEVDDVGLRLGSMRRQRVIQAVEIIET